MAVSDSKALEKWEKYKKSISDSTPVIFNESVIDKKKRMDKLEKDHEAWFKYYFPKYCKAEPADFHKKSSNRIIKNDDWIEQRIWARELAKSKRTMMEVLFLMLTGKMRCFIQASITQDTAVNLLRSYKANLESNNRIINDYGIQQGIGDWTDTCFITRGGLSFYAFGAGMSPRGISSEEVRPDGISIDDMDTDANCRNEDIVKQNFDWCTGALYGTRSISEPLRVWVLGNLISKTSVVQYYRKLADSSEIVNIRDKFGKSTWPQKNTEEMIDRVLKRTNYRSAQKEYFNNPLVEGKTFKSMHYGKCPPINSCEYVVVYADPATSNKDKSGSFKSVIIVGYKNFKFYVYKVWLEQIGTSKFVECLYAADEYLSKNNVDVKKIYIENNSLQDPFWEQVIQPAIKAEAKRRGGKYISVTPDSRKKAEKFYRIEGTLEPIYRNGELIFNIDEKENPQMSTFEEQWYSVDEGSKTMDGPDALEGAVHKIQNRTIQKDTTWVVGSSYSRKY